ncbi:MAG: hypothetical protein WBQ10_12475 [Terriglobales bacterium]
MFKTMCVICICLIAVPAFCQPAAGYQVGTIMDVKIHQVVSITGVSDGLSDLVIYDVTVKVGNTIYVVSYTPPLGMSTVKYAAGRELLVLVGDKTIRYNDILASEVPIVSRKRATEAKRSE